MLICVRIKSIMQLINSTLINESSFNDQDKTPRKIVVADDQSQILECF